MSRRFLNPLSIAAVQWAGVVSLALLLCNCAGTGITSSDDDPMDVKKMVEERIIADVENLEKTNGCQIGLCVSDPDLGLYLEHRGDQLFHAASTMKIPVMIEVFRQADEGLFSMTDTIKVDPWFESMIDGSPYECDATEYLAARIGEEVPILTLVEQMIVVSDNLATNLLIELCGTRRITKTMRNLGAEKSYVVRCLQDEESFRAGFSNRVTARDLVILLKAIEENRAATTGSCAEMRRILLAQEYNDMIPAQLPGETRVGHKTGSITEHRHDAGIVYTPDGKYYITVLSSGMADGDAASAMIAGLSRRIYDHRLELAPRTD